MDWNFKLSIEIDFQSTNCSIFLHFNRISWYLDTRMCWPSDRYSQILPRNSPLLCWTSNSTQLSVNSLLSGMFSASHLYEISHNRFLSVLLHVAFFRCNAVSHWIHHFADNLLNQLCLGWARPCYAVSSLIFTTAITFEATKPPKDARFSILARKVYQIIAALDLLVLPLV